MARPQVIIETEQRGPIEVELLGPEAPLTVANFLRLVDRRFFDRNRWHRVVPNFVVQDGDPRGDGFGGPGGAIRDEINRHRYDVADARHGALGTGHRDRASGSSTLSPQPHLDGTYTVFGRVTGGPRASPRITQGDVIRTIQDEVRRDMAGREPRGRSLVAAAVVLGCWPPRRSCRAQFFSFGQNKIQYRKLDWRILRGPHVDLYYYPAEADLAPAALAYAEASYDTLAVQFGHEVAARIPLIVYASHTDFEQTNILPFTPPEGLLGATDFLKRRVSLPFRGNFAEFRHTLRHELVHVFQLDLLNREPTTRRRGTSRFNLPALVDGGHGRALVRRPGRAGRDGHARPHPERPAAAAQGSSPTSPAAIVYPIGGQIHRWLADTYGDWRVATDVQGAQPPRQLRAPRSSVCTGGRSTS